MKRIGCYAALLSALMTGGLAVAQAQTQTNTETTQAFRFPEAHDAPRSELRVREIPQPGTTLAPAPVPVTDTPESLELYGRCQRNADREATDIADMQSRIAGCLNALNERRQAGQ